MPKRAATKLLLDKTYPRIWHRGEKYADDDKVSITKTGDKEVEAEVRGTKKYKVKLKLIKNGIRRDCDCPYPKSVCKHVVAVAILWDEKRGLKRPPPEEVDTMTRGLPKADKQKLESAFNNPLNADLDIVRREPELVGWPSPRKESHAQLPSCPRIKKDKNEALCREEVIKALKSMEGWTKRRDYDYYFCSGEMAAGFCELLQVIKKRLPASEPGEIIGIMACCIDWLYREFNQIVDGSDGIWIFPEVRMGKIVGELLEKYPQNPAWEKFRKVTKEVGDWWGEPELDEQIIADWKEESL